MRDVPPTGPPRPLPAAPPPITSTDLWLQGERIVAALDRVVHLLGVLVSSQDALDAAALRAPSVGAGQALLDAIDPALAANAPPAGVQPLMDAQSLAYRDMGPADITADEDIPGMTVRAHDPLDPGVFARVQVLMPEDHEALQWDLARTDPRPGGAR